MTARICVGQIGGAHGVRGGVRLRSFTAEPNAIAAYGPLTDESGSRRFTVKLTGTTKDGFLAVIQGVATRDAAEALAGVRLYVERDRLPETDEEEFYHADLIGLRVERLDGAVVGTVRAIHDFGAGDVLEIGDGDGRSELLPFTRAVVPVVDPAGGRLVIDPPLAVDAKPGTETAADVTDGDAP